MNAALAALAAAALFALSGLLLRTRAPQGDGAGCDARATDHDCAGCSHHGTCAE